MGLSPSDQQNVLVIRIDMLERVVHDLQQQLQLYVPAKENEQQLKSIRETVERIEREVTLTKTELSSLNSKLVSQEVESLKRDSEQRDTQNQWQIRMLIGAITAVITVLGGIIVGYVNHFFH